MTLEEFKKWIDDNFRQDYGKEEILKRIVKEITILEFSAYGQTIKLVK